MKVDVIIPTYHPDERFQKCIKMLLQQTVPPETIRIVNTEERFWKKEIENLSPDIVVTHISKQEFDHGASRNLGAVDSTADVLLFMTQDAVPADIYLIEHLLKYLEKENTAAVYARQLPNENCNDLEMFTRQFNYGEKSRVKSQKDISELGIKTYFCSNVCAAYKRDIFVKRNGFISRTIFNEDMIYCGGLIKAGFYVAYAADAKVYHSHNYTPLEQLKRNFDLGVSQADHPEIFEGISSESEGMRLVKETTNHFMKQGNFGAILDMVIQSAFKLIGYQLGKHYKKLSKEMILCFTSNKAYWNKED
ncbi:MAG: glycosyltransferase family 2 protein [Lachnospiraceae bacterium]|nr:glycosyltransferase family 2 protein [Lachnospiraceae bacterium]